MHSSDQSNRPGRELRSYVISSGKRILCSQRAAGGVRVIDVPASGDGPTYLVERGITDEAGLQALLDDYVAQAVKHDHIPMSICLATYFEQALAA